MYTFQTRRREDDDGDDRPQAPARQPTQGSSETAYPRIQGVKYSLKPPDEATHPKSGGGGVAAAIMAARAKRFPQKAYEEEEEEEAEDMYVDDGKPTSVAATRDGGKYGVPKPGATAVGAVAVQGMSEESPRWVSNVNENAYQDTYEDSFVDHSPKAGTKAPVVPSQDDDEPVVARCVSDDEADIEAQVQRRMKTEAKDIADMVHKQLITHAAVAEVQPSVPDTSSLAAQDQDDQVQQQQKRKRLCLIAIGLLVIVVVVCVGVGVAVSKKDDPAKNCSFCYNGYTPANLETYEVEGQTCAEFRESQIQLDSTDSDCEYGQVIAWTFCECPTLPPAPENPRCTLCENGATPLGAGCEELGTFVAHYGEDPLISCDVLRAGVFNESGCTCPCSLCFDGTTPPNLDQACADYRESLIQLDSTDPGCVYGQATAWAECDCPTLPPPPENPQCTLCEAGEAPDSEFCEKIDTYIAHMGENQQFTCVGIRAEAFDQTGCTCIPRPST